eukprot:TRINITY_DN3395_c0_g3_i1.p1 TRINITY_DN3395_c0_g3~~TRINITY_DN3395_c0_g3_i1.p1  ORF type:complete len:172 (+),score=22.47 TRINITY_DN3395_c0_g3_i1:194-709(+)
MVYSSNLVVAVGLAEDELFSPRKATVWATNTSTCLCKLPFSSKVEAIKLNKSRLIACVKDGMHIYDMKTLKFIHSLAISNPLVRFALSPATENCYLVYSDNVERGIVTVYDAQNLIIKQTIDAHKTPVFRLSVNIKGSLLATCSCKVRVVERVGNDDKSVQSSKGGEAVHV